MHDLVFRDEFTLEEIRHINRRYHNSVAIVRNKSTNDNRFVIFESIAGDATTYYAHSFNGDDCRFRTQHNLLCLSVPRLGWINFRSEKTAIHLQRKSIKTYFHGLNLGHLQQYPLKLRGIRLQTSANVEDIYFPNFFDLNQAIKIVADAQYNKIVALSHDIAIGSIPMIRSPVVFRGTTVVGIVKDKVIQIPQHLADTVEELAMFGQVELV